MIGTEFGKEDHSSIPRNYNRGSYFITVGDPFFYVSSSIYSGNELNIYLNPRVHDSIHTKEKNFTR
jgi:hypothetical protein